MTWQQGGPTGITFQRAAVAAVYALEARPGAEKARQGSVGGPGMWNGLMLLVAAEEVKRPRAGGWRKSF